MPDIAEFAGMITSLRAVAELAKLVVDAHDAGVRREKSLELQGQIVSALEDALTAQMAQSAQLKRVRELEEKMAQLETWNTEKEKYELVNIRDESTTQHFGAAWVRSLKPDTQPPEPPHQICPDCYQRSEKIVLQEEQRPGRIRVVFCQRCHFEISRTGPWEPDTSRWATAKKR
ncbi:MAG: hypothetical protein WA624_03200 [Methylocella sp.]